MKRFSLLARLFCLWVLFVCPTAIMAVSSTSATYMVIDLSGGTSATTYPVSYLEDVPSGGWSDEYKTTKLVMRRIEAGTFTMGSPTSELGRSSNELQHRVTLSKPYYIGVFEVTQKQWQLVMGNNPSRDKGDAHPVECVCYDDIRGSSLGSAWPTSADVDATSFIGKLRQKIGDNGFDLPTEAQWEYACRAGTTTALNSGKNLESATAPGCSNLAELGGNVYSNGEVHRAVGSFLPNNWLLYDMHANVAEWCLDWYTDTPNTEAVADPQGPVSGTKRNFRGGGWGTYARGCRSAARSSNAVSVTDAGLGFRLMYETVNSTPIKLNYTVDDNQVVITGYEENLPEELTIPSLIEGKPVTAIAASAFKGNKTITSVKLPTSLKEVGASAFTGCTNLKSVTFPSTLTTIRQHAFSSTGITGLVTLPASLTTLEYAAFFKCPNIISATIKTCTQLTTIGEAAFRECANFTAVSLPDSLTTIGARAFYLNAKLNRVSLVSDASKIATIGDYAFSGCAALPTFNFAKMKSLKKLGQHAFSNSGLSGEITLSAGMTDIGASAFASCSALSKIAFLGNPPNVGATPFPSIVATYLATYASAWNAVIVDGKWNGLTMRIEGAEPEPEPEPVSSIQWSHEGTPWTITSETPFTAQSGTIGDGGNSTLVGAVVGRGTLSFKWKVSSESGCDWLAFYIDGQQQQRISGEQGWADVTVELTNFGTHTFQWTYSKDRSISRGSDCGWISDVAWAQQDES